MGMPDPLPFHPTLAHVLQAMEALRTLQRANTFIYMSVWLTKCVMMAGGAYLFRIVICREAISAIVLGSAVAGSACPLTAIRATSQ
jgi:hypothetical protein